MPVVTINILIICATIVALIGSRTPGRERKRNDNDHTKQ